MPRPKLKPTDDQRLLVKHLSAVGIPQEQIALRIGIRSPKTLRKYFRAELTFGAMEANANVGGWLYESARHHVGAQMFWLINRAGWRRPATHAAPAAAPPFIVAREKDKEAA